MYGVWSAEQRQGFIRWLTSDGFTAVKHINTARVLLAFAREAGAATKAQQDALAALEAAHDTAVAAVDQAADTMCAADTAALKKARVEMRKQAEMVAALFAYPKGLSWAAAVYWDKDVMVNERQLIWR